MTTPRHTLSRRIAATALALGTAATLAAGCSKDEPQDSSAAATSGSAAAGTGAAPSGSPVPGQPGSSATPGAPGAPASPGAPGAPASTVSDQPAPNGDPNPRPAGAPTASLDQLVLSAGDAPEFGLVAVPADQAAQLFQQQQASLSGAKVEPAGCELDISGFNPRAAASQTGKAGQTPLTVAVTSDVSAVTTTTSTLDRCATVTRTVPMPNGQTISGVNKRQRLAAPAPEGVTEFSAFRQDSALEVAGQKQDMSLVSVVGVVRGIGVQVAVINPAGPLDDAARDAALGAFAKQADKLRRAS